MKSFWSAAGALLLAAAVAQPAAACTTNADCSDGNLCNGVETCQAGVCVAGIPLVCDDGNACTTNVCDSSAGCAFLPSDGCMISGRRIKMGSRKDLRFTMQMEPDIAGPAFPPSLGSGDPVLNGATLRLFTNAGDMFDTTYSMPKANWHYIHLASDNDGYRYQDLQGVYGPIRYALIRNGKPSKLKGGGAALMFSLNQDPNPVNAVLQLGDKQFCVSFGGIAKYRPGIVFKAKKSAPPAACPFP